MALDGAVSANLFRFGDEFDLDLNAFELRRAGQPIRLGRIPMELLLLLIEQRGQLVTREKIIDRVWGKDVFLDTDNSINAAIRKIRQVLEDDAEAPRYVQTLIGRGYRFVGKITHISGLESRRANPKKTEREPQGPCSDPANAASGMVPAAVLPATSPDTSEAPSLVSPRPQVAGDGPARKPAF